MSIDEVKKLMNKVNESNNKNLYVLERYTNLKMTPPAKRLDESGINRMISHLKDGGVIISASKSLTDEGDVPDNLTDEYAKWVSNNEKEGRFKKTDYGTKEEFIKEFSRVQTKKLLQELKESQYSYSPVYGGYKSEDGITDLYEPSFVVYCHDRDGNKLDFEELKKYGLDLCKRYYQDSVYVREPDGKSYYYDCDGNVIGQESDNPSKINRTEEPYFTALNKGHNQRFTDDIQWLEEGHNMGSGEWFTNPGHYSFNSKVLRTNSGEIIL